VDHFDESVLRPLIIKRATWRLFGSSPSDVAGLFKLAFIEDPWGTRIEVVQDAEKLGLHHVHLRSPDAAGILAWYVDKFGGSLSKFKGRLDGIDYGGVWMLAQQGPATPSAGHSIDHMGMRPMNVDNAVTALKAKTSRSRQSRVHSRFRAASPCDWRLSRDLKASASSSYSGDDMEPASSF